MCGYLRLTHQKEEEAFPFSHIILDEVHERSVESDLLCFILKEKLMVSMDGNPKKRGVVAPPKLILMSATLQTGLFSEYFLPVFQKRQKYIGGSSGGGNSGCKVPSLEVGARCPYNVSKVAT